ncbi:MULTISPECIES: antibiotic biosynthesis monooxygenase [Pseudomonas]|uniref:ABM domain-containing protein n=1 Tax=Pseudomonas flexibilis TaxID=706570 RepID=A0A1N6VP06_9PSED|nr:MULTISPECIES: antibiotic biosynthesis monooxygenase [Pseudomonas]KHL70489.1 antibiotic biosynthesis monooxygenase [Pseudomonas flexibilis]SIQ79537.1 hypothetical protein SAMN05421672_11057 [Pseudomonas flexibilis]
MPTPPMTLLVARRVEPAHYTAFIEWMHEGERLAADFPGYLGSGMLAPPPGDNEFQMIFRFSDPDSLAAWEHSASRQAWLQRGQGLFDRPHEHRALGLDGWFNEATRPPRWKQSLVIWLAFFPVSLLFNLLFGGYLADWPMPARVLVTTLALTPLMTYLVIPQVTRLLAPWLQRPTRASARLRALLARH